MSAPRLQLLRKTTCPHCWSTFAPEEVLWVSAHSDLLGDPRLGPEQPQRFLPTRFTVDGNALDARGFVCHVLACPRCHLPVPRALLEIEPFFVSILGTPACGKSYYLTSLAWELRRVLPHLALAFADADTLSNRSLNESEESLFLNPKANDLVPLADLIRKTELQGELYQTVMYGNQAVSYICPFLFAVRPLEQHPHYASTRQLARLLCLYDNAGEHFLVGKDAPSSPVTRHLAESRLLLFLFDPTQDQRFRQLCQDRNSSSLATVSGRTSRQESVLQEAATRIRRYTGLPQNSKHPRPLMVVLTKSDAWAPLLEDRSTYEPWVREDSLLCLDLPRIEQRSNSIRKLLLRVCPEIVTTAETFAQEVLYVAVSALGRTPEPHPQTNSAAIRPRDIAPIWVTIPLLRGICRWLPALIPAREGKPIEAPHSGTQSREPQETVRRSKR